MAEFWGGRKESFLFGKTDIYIRGGGVGGDGTGRELSRIAKHGSLGDFGRQLDWKPSNTS